MFTRSSATAETARITMSSVVGFGLGGNCLGLGLGLGLEPWCLGLDLGLGD